MILAKDVTKRFGDKAALYQLNCTIPAGCVYGLVGANGAGKSTFLRLAAGIYQADEGELTLDGKRVFDEPDSKQRVAFVPDELYFLPGADLQRMVKLYEAAYPRFDRAYFDKQCAVFDLPKRSINGYSKGMRRQAAFLLAMSCRPDYLLMDETFDGLDPIIRNLVRRLIYEDVTERGLTAVLTSHSLRELEDTCDQLALIHQGGIVFESEVEKLKTKLFKVQIAFNEPFDQSRFQDFDLLQYRQSGSVAGFLVRGDRENTRERLSAMQPVLLELLPLSLEEVFVYELDALGYVFEPAAKEASKA